MTSFLIVLFGVTNLYLVMTSRIEASIRILALQGVLLFLLTMAGSLAFHWNALFLTAETLGFRAILVPWFLTMTVRRNEMFRENAPSLPHFYSLVIASLILGLGFYVSYLSDHIVSRDKALFFGISISTMITALFIIMTRKKLLTHVVGYMILENGIYLLSMSAAKEMPLIVNLGALLDVFVGLFLLGLFATQIQASQSDMDIDHLNRLKD